MTIRAIVFDCNGVISDDEPLHFRALQRALAEAGIPIDERAYLAKYLAYDDKGSIARAFAEAGKPCPGAVRDDFAERKRRYYAELVQNDLRIFPGVAAFVRAAAARYATAIGSGALRAEIDMILTKSGIADCFRVIVSAEEIERCKPAPDCYLLALEKLQALPDFRQQPLRADACLVIEDAKGGVAAAKAAGMRVVAVTNSYRPEELAHADVVVPTLEGLTPEALIARLR